MFTIYYADFIGVANNCLYPHKVEVNNIEDLKRAVSRDYVCASYKNNYRNNRNFIASNCLPVDCDNDHSENPTDWITPDDVKTAFPNVSFAVHYSRNHNIEKLGKAARPKFHVIFPIDRVEDVKVYSNLKKQVNEIFSYFDDAALDSARFFFGTNNPNVEIIKGSMNLSEFLGIDEFDSDFGIIKEGSRNKTMSHFASKVIKRYGDTDKAYQCFIEESKKCSPPLEKRELNSIWHSAKKFFARIVKEGRYIPPEEYNVDGTYKPSDYSDVGQAIVLGKNFENELRYSPATHYIRYKDNYWQESEPGAQAVAHELTRRQLQESTNLVFEALQEMKKNGASNIVNSAPKSKVESLMDESQLTSYQKYLDAKAYQAFAIKRRESRNITATLKEARPIIEISLSELDADPFLLCTPNATFDLRKGLDGAREHRAEDFITKITSVSVSDKGKDIWHNALNTIFQNDKELIDYVQMICGLAAIGKVYVEALIIAYGEGSNGKSTFWNTISRVLGLYSGNISADTLTVGVKRNIKPEMAEMKGKRLLLAAESQEGARLNDSMVKQLCSTDDVFAEKKYKDPFSFKPCHTLVLYTNHLPKVGASDDGIWRRLIVIPFNAKIKGSSDIKNFSEYLFDNAGESILAWIIEGAKKVIDAKYKIKPPTCVAKAIQEYKEQNDWFHHFLVDCLEVDPSFIESSSSLYTRYRNYCIQTNEYVRSTTDFYNALEKAGFKRIVKKNKRFFEGIKIKDDANEDFLD